MGDYEDVFRKIASAVEGIELLRRTAFQQYSILVEAGHSYQLMDELFALLKKLKPISKNGARSLWICAKRGTINDFAKR